MDRHNPFRKNDALTDAARQIMDQNTDVKKPDQLNEAGFPMTGAIIAGMHASRAISARQDKWHADNARAAYASKRRKMSQAEKDEEKAKRKDEVHKNRAYNAFKKLEPQEAQPAKKVLAVRRTGLFGRKLKPKPEDYRHVPGQKARPDMRFEEVQMDEGGPTPNLRKRIDPDQDTKFLAPLVRRIAAGLKRMKNSAAVKGMSPYNIARIVREEYDETWLLTINEDAFDNILEKHLTTAETKKREEVVKAIKRDNPGMDKSKAYAMATATAKRVAEEEENEEVEQLDELTLPKNAKAAAKGLEKRAKGTRAKAYDADSGVIRSQQRKKEAERRAKELESSGLDDKPGYAYYNAPKMSNLAGIGKIQTLSSKEQHKNQKLAARLADKDKAEYVARREKQAQKAAGTTSALDRWKKRKAIKEAVWQSSIRKPTHDGRPIPPGGRIWNAGSKAPSVVAPNAYSKQKAAPPRRSPSSAGDGDA